MRLMTETVEGGIFTPQLAFVGYFMETLVEATSMKTKGVMRPLLNLIPPALVFYFIFCLTLYPKS